MENEFKRLAILGSTGSIGRQTLDIVRTLPHKYRVIALAAGNNSALFEQQIREFKPRYVYSRSKKVCASAGDYELLSLDDIARHPEADIIVAATSGKSGLLPTIAAVKAGKQIALANKESLVMAGEIVTGEAKLSGARILPVDSEHSAIWQCLQGEPAPRRIILTASGGSFLHYSKEQLEQVTIEQALNHPSWKMGKKITIDSATLLNKGLEVIEAHWLFEMPYDNIKVLIHPQCIIHSLVEFVDGAAKAQMGCPDMRLPIQYALSHPERLNNPAIPRLDWSRIASLTLEEPDYDTFPCLKMAIEAGRKNGTYPAVLCSADEIAVDLFLKGIIRFTDIPRLIERVLAEHDAIDKPDLSEIMAADAWASERVQQLAGARI